MKYPYAIGGSLLAIVAIAGLAFYPQSRKTQQSGGVMPDAVAFRISMGVGDRQATEWNGSIKTSAGQITNIEITRPAAGDETDGKSSWKVASRPALVRLNAAAKKKAGKKKKGAGGPIANNGIVVTATGVSPDTQFDVKLTGGSFSFKASQAQYGSSYTAMDGRVEVERVPTAVALMDSEEDQDFPAMAQTPKEILLAYVEFSHSNRALEQPGILDAAPKNFDEYARPVGGDRVKLMRYDKQSRKWSAPEDISPAKEDCMRTAVAVDGQQRVWVIWSAHRGDNFDLYARYQANGRWSPEVRITKDAGNDINPVAATDSNGRVWIAWQAYRNRNLEVLTAVQNGTAFSTEQTVSFSPNSDWDPSIAAGPNGEVAIAWDTFDKGDYDVYLRKARYENGIKMQEPLAVAASQNFEARGSVAYDGQGRIWVAYEGSAKKWGKDFGAYEKSGVAIYQGHEMYIRCVEGGRVMESDASLADAIRDVPGFTGRQARVARQTDTKTNESIVTGPQMGPKNSFPRLAADRDGRVFLAFRASTGQRAPAGPVWTQFITYLDGDRWVKAVPIPHTDGLLDYRPAVVSYAPGEVMMAVMTDHRQMMPGGARPRRAAGESLNTDIYAAQMTIDHPAQRARVKSVDAKVDAPEESAKAEAASIDLMRKYRGNVAGAQLQLVRGEFHRHTEFSSDGGNNDGPLIDAYRYLIDSAGMDWAGCCDHDNGSREYLWWIEQKLTDAYNMPGRYIGMFAYERSVRYPEGHRNVVFPQRGIRPLKRLPKMADDSSPTPAPDTQMLYRYLRQFGGIVASHTSGTDMGTDWRDNDPILEPIVEIYQGDRQSYEMPGAPRSNSADYSLGGWRPLGFVSLALQKGYRLGFQASSDHVSTHMSYCNLWVTAPTREAVMEAFHKRRIYGSTDNILADVRCGTHFMGEEFSINTPPVISVKLTGTDEFAKVSVIRDSTVVYMIEPKQRQVSFEWQDNAAQKGKTSYYYVRGEQKDGELVWASPMWINYQ